MIPDSPFAAITLSAFVLLTFPSEGEADEKSASWRGQSITEFTSEENDRMGWQVVNDGVMGGLSKGKLEFTREGVMKFAGTLSLQNNGGFTTARSAPVELNLSSDLGILLLVKGDGRTYEARLDSDALYRGGPVSFSGEFTATAGEWQQIKIPFSDFKGSWRGTNLPNEKLNPADIRRVSILLGDKKEGPFCARGRLDSHLRKRSGEFHRASEHARSRHRSEDITRSLEPDRHPRGRRTFWNLEESTRRRRPHPLFPVG